MHELIAIHEAGHAVVALALGVELVKVDSFLDQQTEIASATSAAFRAATVTPEDAIRAALFALGGWAYEHVLCGDDPLPPFRSECRGPDDDVTRAYHFTDLLNAGKPEPIALQLVAREAIAVLKRNAKPAKAITDGLLGQGGRLTGQEADAIWAAAGGRLEGPEFVRELLASLEEGCLETST